MDKEFSRYQDELEWLRETGQIATLEEKTASEHQRLRRARGPIALRPGDACSACGRKPIERIEDEHGILYVHWYYPEGGWRGHRIIPGESHKPMVMVTCKCGDPPYDHAHLRTEVDEVGQSWEVMESRTSPVMKRRLIGS